MTKRTNEELIKAAADGDLAAFEKLVRQLEPRVAATVIGMLGQCPEANDVGQETFIRFYKSLKNFRGESSVASYVTRIAINLSLNELKRRKKNNLKMITLDSDVVLNLADPKAQIDSYEYRELVEKSLRELSQDYRIVVVLRLIEGYSTKEVAKLLKIPIGTVMSRLSRAQAKLKELVEVLSGEKR